MNSRTRLAPPEIDPRCEALAARLYERLVLDADLQRYAEENGLEPGDHHRDLARRAIAAAATFHEELVSSGVREVPSPRRAYAV